jgi:hypothetical protein
MSRIHITILSTLTEKKQYIKPNDFYRQKQVSRLVKSSLLYAEITLISQLSLSRGRKTFIFTDAEVTSMLEMISHLFKIVFVDTP